MHIVFIGDGHAGGIAEAEHHLELEAGGMVEQPGYLLGAQNYRQLVGSADVFGDAEHRLARQGDGVETDVDQPRNLAKSLTVESGTPRRSRMAGIASQAFCNAPCGEICAGNEADHWPEIGERYRSGEIQPRHGRLKIRGQVGQVLDQTNLRPQVVAENFQSGQIEPIAGGGNDMVGNPFGSVPLAIGQVQMHAVSANLGTLWRMAKEQ